MGEFGSTTLFFRLPVRSPLVGCRTIENSAPLSGRYCRRRERAAAAYPPIARRFRSAVGDDSTVRRPVSIRRSIERVPYRLANNAGEHRPRATTSRRLNAKAPHLGHHHPQNFANELHTYRTHTNARRSAVNNMFLPFNYVILDSNGKFLIFFELGEKMSGKIILNLITL